VFRDRKRKNDIPDYKVKKLLTFIQYYLKCRNHNSKSLVIKGCMLYTVKIKKGLESFITRIFKTASSKQTIQAIIVLFPGI